MRLILNIGLAREGKPDLTIVDVYDALQQHDLVFGRVVLRESDTETTAVVRVDTTLLGVDVSPRDAIYSLAQYLGQDCIAVWQYLPAPRRGEGRLIGPNAAKWGAFNPEFFILDSGRRLSETFTPVAA